MPIDPLAGLFKYNYEIDLQGASAVAANARRLAQEGFLAIDECAYVRCVNPLDRDGPHPRGMSCWGRIYLSSDLDEHEAAYECPDCGRVVYPSLKQSYPSIRIMPVLAAMRAYVREQLERLRVTVEERPAGLYRIPIEAGEVQVCLVDACRDAEVFTAIYPYRSRLVYVVGNARDFAPRLPEAAATYRLAELVLGGASASFRRTVRHLLGQRAAPAPLGPALLPPHMTLLRPERAPSTAAMHRLRIEVPPNTTWSHIHLYLVDGETVAIRVPGRKPARYTYQTLGMAHARTATPTKKWSILEALCEGYGETPWNRISRSFGAFKEQVSGLRRLLQTLFGIHADPFPECSQRNGLRAAFQASPGLPDPPLADPTAWAPSVRSDRSAVTKSDR